MSEVIAVMDSRLCSSLLQELAQGLGVSPSVLTWDTQRTSEPWIHSPCPQSHLTSLLAFGGQVLWAAQSPVHGVSGSGGTSGHLSL